MNLKFTKCTINDLDTLREFSAKTFIDTFESTNSEENMNEYLAKAFTNDKLRDELLNEESAFYFLYNDGVLAGYIKLNEGNAQSDINDPHSIELERIYVAKEFHSMGLGKVLMNKAFEFAVEKEKNHMWLGVWEHNDKAISFYKKHGFAVTGQHSFFMGDDEQLDYIMRKDLK